MQAKVKSKKQLKIPFAVGRGSLVGSTSTPKSDDLQISEAADALIDQIWEIYDTDNSGTLDQDETKQFMKQYMEMMGFQDRFSNDVFQQMF